MRRNRVETHRKQKKETVDIPGWLCASGVGFTPAIGSALSCRLGAAAAQPDAQTLTPPLRPTPWTLRADRGGVTRFRNNALSSTLRTDHPSGVRCQNFPALLLGVLLLRCQALVFQRHPFCERPYFSAESCSPVGPTACRGLRRRPPTSFDSPDLPSLQKHRRFSAPSCGGSPPDLRT